MLYPSLHPHPLYLSSVLPLWPWLALTKRVLADVTQVHTSKSTCVFHFSLASLHLPRDYVQAVPWEDAICAAVSQPHHCRRGPPGSAENQPAPDMCTDPAKTELSRHPTAGCSATCVRQAQHRLAEPCRPLSQTHIYHYVRPILRGYYSALLCQRTMDTDFTML